MEESCHHISKGCSEQSKTLQDKNKTKTVLRRGARPGHQHCSRTVEEGCPPSISYSTGVPPHCCEGTVLV